MSSPVLRARGMAMDLVALASSALCVLVPFAVGPGAIWGPLVFGPMFSGRAFDAHDLTVPWLAAGLFTTAGLLVSFAARHDPRDMSRAFVEHKAPKSLREILRRPGVGTAMVAAVASFAVMAGV